MISEVQLICLLLYNVCFSRPTCKRKP